MGLTLEGEDKDKLGRLTEVVSYNKSAHKSCIHYFYESRVSGLVLETLLAYWLSWFISPSGQDRLSSYIFSSAILLAKGRKVVVAPIYLT